MRTNKQQHASKLNKFLFYLIFRKLSLKKKKRKSTHHTNCTTVQFVINFLSFLTNLKDATKSNYSDFIFFNYRLNSVGFDSFFVYKCYVKGKNENKYINDTIADVMCKK